MKPIHYTSSFFGDCRFYINYFVGCCFTEEFFTYLICMRRTFRDRELIFLTLNIWMRSEVVAVTILRFFRWYFASSSFIKAQNVRKFSTVWFQACLSHIPNKKKPAFVNYPQHQIKSWIYLCLAYGSRTIGEQMVISIIENCRKHTK